jgi:hypothetical protein
MGSSMISTSEKETLFFLEEEEEEAGDRLVSPNEAVDESKFKDLAEELRDGKDMVHAAPFEV